MPAQGPLEMEQCAYGTQRQAEEDKASNTMPRETHPDFNSLGGGRARNTPEGTYFLGSYQPPPNATVPRLASTEAQDRDMSERLPLHCMAPAERQERRGNPPRHRVPCWSASVDHARLGTRRSARPSLLLKPPQQKTGPLQGGDRAST